MNSNYPIQPHHLDTSREPKGFDALIGYGPKIILWASMQFWQHKGKWEQFTHDEFIAFISDQKAKVNPHILHGMYFIEPVLGALLNCNNHDPEHTRNPTYHPTHFVISTYFLHNAAPSK